MTSPLTTMLTFLLVAGALGCAPARSGAPAAHPGPATSTLAPDGGLAPPHSDRKGVIVPSDTGLGSQPNGTSSQTGTSGGRTGLGTGTGN